MTGPPSVETAVEARLARIHERDGELRSLVRLDEDAALAAARLLDRRVRRGGRPGSLFGTTFVVKDNIDVAGQVTACCSRAHEDRPAAADAPVVARLRRAGAVLLGRTNMDELAMGASTATSVHGSSRNPWDLRRSPGGSSGGCAVAVAAGLADLAVGTDTGGSVREPAAQCGVFGFAPSPGLLPTAGVVPFDPACDRVGPLATSLRLLTDSVAVMSGRSPRDDDPTALHRVVPAGLRVGLVDELCADTNQGDVLDNLAGMVDRLRRSGAEVAGVSLPDAPRALAAYLDLTSTACVPHLEGWVATGRTGPEVTRRVGLGRQLLAAGPAALAEAEAVRDRLRAQVRDAWDHFDVLLCPTLPTTAPLFAPAGPPTADVSDPMTAPYTDCWTVVANLTGLPALSVPSGTSPYDGMPTGAMVMARPGADAMLLAVGERLAALADDDLVATPA